MSLKLSTRRLLKKIYIRAGRPGEKKINELRGKTQEESLITGTEYFDEIDSAHLSALSSYKTGSSSQTLETTFSNINSQFFDAYGPDYELKTAANVTIDPVWYYQDLLTRIQKIPNVRFATCKDGLENPPLEDEIVCTIRHDVDGDLVAAVQQAEIEHKLNIPSSFYLLHNAPYYGVLTEQGGQTNQFTTLFSRHESSVEAYKKIQGLGHELALHTDGMDYYQRLNTDGAQAVREEIQWLREQGCDIQGTTAHNSFSVYGCNNYSIFKNRPLGMSTSAGPKAVSHNGKWAPLQTLDEKELGLKYEANDYFWQDSTPLLYGCLMTQNNWYIAENQYGLLSPETKDQRQPLVGRYGSHDDIIDAIANLTGPAYVKLVVHPMHYGLRSHYSKTPWLADAPINESQGKAKLWAGGGRDGEIKGSAINYLNEFGTPDRGISCYNSADFKIAVIGGKNANTLTVSSDSKFSQIAARLIRGPIQKLQSIAISAANDECDLSKLARHFDKILTLSKPDVVVLNIDLPCGDLTTLNTLTSLASATSDLLIVLTDGPADTLAFELNKFENLVFIDPTSTFEQYQGSAPIKWAHSDLWSLQAHHLVGKIIAEVIISHYKNV